MSREAVGAAMRALAGPAARERARRWWALVRRRPDVLVALALGAGLLAMVLHWR